MSNANAPFGFSPSRRIDGAAGNFAANWRKIASANTNKVFKGDPVVSLGTGYVDIAAPGATQIAGIAWEFHYLSKVFGRTIWPAYWSGGGDANGDIDVLVINDPNLVFEVQSANGGPVVLGNVDNNINFGGQGNGNTASGLSAAYIDFATIGTTSTLPFRIVGLGQGVLNDNTSAFNTVEVVLNWTDLKSTTGI